MSAGLPPSAGNSSLPCEVVAVLDEACVSCHGASPRQGAPLSLLTAGDFAAVREDGMSIGARVVARVQDPVRPMPPPPAAVLSSDQIATLMAFVDGGAAPVASGCVVNDPSAGDPVGNPTTGATPGGMSPTTMPPGTQGSMATPSGTGEWRMFGHDLGNSRANLSETTLSADNVANLQMQWQFTGPATTSTPAVVEGTVYLPGWDATVRALSLMDGSEVWSASLPNLIDSSPAVTDTQVFVSDNRGLVHALNRADGELAWSVQIDSHQHAHLWSSPVYIEDENLVVVGVASGEEAEAAPYTFRGSVVGLDAATGQIRWQLYTTSGDQMSGAGVAVWGTAAVDPGRKMLFIGTGNNYNAPAGTYADSLLAIDYKLGEIVWSHQFANPDIFTVGLILGGGPDSDVGSTANLFSVDGKDLVGIGVKDGVYYALDRDAGTVQWMAPLTSGSVLGGVISPSAYANGVVYVASNRFSEGLTDLVAIDARDGSELWRSTLTQITYGGVAYANGVVYLGNDSAQVLAVNAENGNTLWNDAAPNAIAGGPAVASGLLLVPWGYQWTLGRGGAGRGGLLVYGL